MVKESISKCPVCGDAMTITKLQCNCCQTVIEGEFTGCDFCKISKEDRIFALTFIKNRGSIKEIEKELGISYPTVKSKLDHLIAALNVAQKSDTTTTEILEQLNNGVISVKDAIKNLEEMRK